MAGADRSLAVKVSGLSELRAALAQIMPGTERIVGTRLLFVAGKIAAAVRSAMPFDQGYASSTVRTGMVKGGAWVAEGSDDPDDYVAWLDFGGTVGRGHQRGPNMGAIHRPWMGKPGGEGRYIYPQVRAHRQDILVAIDDAVKEAAEAAGFETAGKGYD